MKPPQPFTDKIPRTVFKIVEKLVQKGFQAYPVGGGIRDILLKRKVTDWDIATSARPEQVTPLFSRVIPTGIEHGTVTVLVGKQKVEVTTFRGEIGYSDGRHPDGVRFLDSLQEDLKRRDFTINAMAYDCQKNKLIDPFSGFKDLQKKIVRAVGDPKERFSEDGLRPMRAVRFACLLGFSVEKATWEAIGSSIPTFDKIAQERIREELNKMLASRQAYQGIELLQSCGLLKSIIPELTETIGFAQNPFHRHDVYQHTLKSLQKSRGDAILKLAVLLHDIGKPQSAEGKPGFYTFYAHENVSSKMADSIMRRLKYSKAERNRVFNLIANHMFYYEDSWTDGAVRRLVKRVGQKNLKDLFEIRRADAWGRGLEVQSSLQNLNRLIARIERVLQKDTALKITDLALNGKDLMELLNIPEGPEVGRILKLLLEMVLENQKLNTANELKKLAQQL